MLVIGESLNAAVAKVGRAIQERDDGFVSRLAQEQRDAGAQMLDVNAAVPGGNEVDDLAWLVRTVQTALDLPLMVDSASPDALRSALSVHKGRAIVNSVSGEPKKLDKVLPLVAEHGCGVVVLGLNEKGIPATAEARFEVASMVARRARDLGVKAEDIYVDPLVLTIATDVKAASVCLATLRLVREKMPDVHTIGGISNISFGLPVRSLLNCAFLSMAMGLGMDTLFVNVRDKATMATIWAANALSGSDVRCRDYLKAYRAGRLKV